MRTAQSFLKVSELVSVVALEAVVLDYVGVAATAIRHVVDGCFVFARGHPVHEPILSKG